MINVKKEGEIVRSQPVFMNSASKQGCVFPSDVWLLEPYCSHNLFSIAFGLCVPAVFGQFRVQ